nr:hypothetical protein [Tanacetum cinerariifolium]
MRCRDTLEVFWDVNYRDSSRKYVPRDYVPVFVPEFEHPKDLVPAEDEAPASLLPPRFLSPRIQHLSLRALRAEMNVIASSLYHSLHPSGTPPLLPIPLSTPSTSRRAGIPEADTPPRNRPLLATPRPGCEVDVCTRESLEFYTRHHDAQKDRTAVRAEIEVLRSERLSYKQEVLETHARRLEWQRQAADDFAVQHIMRTQALEAGACDDTLEDTGDHCTKQIIQIMGRTRRGQTPPPTNPNNPNNMTPEAVQTMIDQALLRNSDGEDGSHSSHAKNPRNMHTARPFYYADFMKCHPLNFKGTEGAVDLTRWIEKMESVFNISGCAVENQVKFATCTLLDATLTWWNKQIRTLGLDAYTITWSVIKKKMTGMYCPLGENVTKAYNLESAEKKTYEGNAPKCTKCQRNHSGPCTLKCHKCGKIGDYARDCRSTGNTNAINNRGRNGPNPRGNGCFECGDPRHFKRDGPKLKNKNGGNGNAQGWVYAVGNAERNGNVAGNPDSNVVTGTFLLNNRYASILFDTDVDRSFVSSAFVTPRFLDIWIWSWFVANETEKIDKYISGLPDNIYGSVKSSRPKMLDETIELANNFMDQKLRTYAERQTDNKRKAGDSSRNNHGHQQQPAKRKNVTKVYHMGSSERKPYGGNLPKSSGNTNVANAQRDNRANPKGNGCFVCGAP